MKHSAIALSLALALAACGSPKDEDKLSPEDIRASESAPELPDIALSENPEPQPAAPPAVEPANDMADVMENEAGPDELGPLPGSEPIPAAFHGRWGMTIEDCTDPRRDASTALVVSRAIRRELHFQWRRRALDVPGGTVPDRKQQCADPGCRWRASPLSPLHQAQGLATGTVPIAVLVAPP
jgi:hypothetical protein